MLRGTVFFSYVLEHDIIKIKVTHILKEFLCIQLLNG